MFKLNLHRPVTVRVKGIFQRPIQFVVNVIDGNWSPYFGKYQNQKWGIWDSDSCWALSAINSAEDQIEWLWKNNQFSEEAKKFFTDNGYIDGDGDFSLSERFTEILGQQRDDGSNSEMAWTLMQKYGCIPRSMLDYSAEQANKWGSREAFNNDYFNMSAVTPAMKALGVKFRQYVNIAYQKIGKGWTTPDLQILRKALQQAPINIGIPVPRPQTLWNSTFIKYDGGKTTDHEVEMYAIDQNGNYLIFDQYLPNLKVLSANYYLPLCTQGILYATPAASTSPVVQDIQSNSIWTAIMNWFNGITLGVFHESSDRM